MSPFWVLAQYFDVLVVLSLIAVAIGFMVVLMAGSIALAASDETRWASDYSDWQLLWVKTGDKKSRSASTSASPCAVMCRSTQQGI